MTAGRPTRRAVLAVVAILSLAAAGPLTAAAASQTRQSQAREKWDTRVFSLVPPPGHPAYVYAHPDGRIYAATYDNPKGDSRRSRVFEWQRDGTLLRSWTVPGQDLSADHGVQVATSDSRGRLVLLEKSTARVLTLNLDTGRFRRYARIPDVAGAGATDGPPIPNYATWGPHGALYVSDYGQPVIWRIPPGGGRPRAWLRSPKLDGGDFGTAGLVLGPGHHRLFVTQQSSQGGTVTDPTSGKLYTVRIRHDGSPGHLVQRWESQPGDLPDGFGIARSGHVYVACAGLSNQLVELAADGTEMGRFPQVPGSGDNGSAIPFDTPSSATFVGRRLLVANQSYFDDTSHHAILDVRVGERGVLPFIPARAGRR